MSQRSVVHGQIIPVSPGTQALSPMSTAAYMRRNVLQCLPAAGMEYKPERCHNYYRSGERAIQDGDSINRVEKQTHVGRSKVACSSSNTINISAVQYTQLPAPESCTVSYIFTLTHLISIANTRTDCFEPSSRFDTGSTSLNNTSGRMR